MKRWKSLAAAACLLAGLARAQDAAGRTWAKAVEAFNGKSYESARALCQEYEKLKPGTAEAPYLMEVARWAEVYGAVEQAKKDGAMGEAERQKLRQKWGEALADGHRQASRALAVDADLADALAYDNLLYRLEAQIAGTGSAARQLLSRADARIAEAKVARQSSPQKRVAGMPPAPPPPPPPPPRKEN
jgi:hypothetical protein